jgi:putative heme-binding domain-containing protein
VKGEGGFLGSDLTAYGQTHNSAAIVKATTTPDSPLIPGSRVVEIRTKSGQNLSGVVRSEDNFTIELQTTDGRFHFFDRSTLADVKYTDHSLMPHDYGTRLTPAELNDIASFLVVTGRSAPTEAPLRRRRSE